MKKFITFLCCLFSALVVVSQSAPDDYYSPAKRKLFSKDRVVTSLSMGTNVSFLNSKSSGITTFIAPKIGYQVTDKFQLNIGLMHYTLTGNTFIPINNHEALYNGSYRNVSGNFIFAEGQYQLNKRLNISGAVMADINGENNQCGRYKEVSLGLNYKVTEHSYIGISGTLSQGNTQNYFFNSQTNSFEYLPSNGEYGLFSQLATGMGQWGAKSLNTMIR